MKSILEAIETAKPISKSQITFVIPFTYPCLWYEQTVHFVDGKGWSHPGGESHIMECPECNWMGEELGEGVITHDTDICTKCGVQGKLRDNHITMPNRNAKEKNG
jgi:hypothetical protein